MGQVGHQASKPRHTRDKGVPYGVPFGVPFELSTEKWDKLSPPPVDKVSHNSCIFLAIWDTLGLFFNRYGTPKTTSI